MTRSLWSFTHRVRICVCALFCGFAFTSCQGGNSTPQTSTLPLSTVTPTAMVTPSNPGALALNTPAGLAGGASTPSAQISTAVNSTSTAPVPVSLTYRLPTAAAMSLVSSRAKLGRQLEYISASNVTITIVVTPLGGNGTTYGPSACTTGSCVVSFTATPGVNSLAFQLKDGSNNVLSSFTTFQAVKPGGLNTLNFTAVPVVSSIALQLASTTETAGTAVDDLLTVNAQDPDGNTIVGNSNYVGINGNPIILYLSVSNNQAGGKGSVKLRGSTVINAPGQSATYAHYDGNWLASSTISATSSSNALTNITPATMTTIPHVTTYAVSGAPAGIVNGPDGNIWFAESGNNAIGRITPLGSATTYSCTPCSSPGSPTVGPDNNIWFTGTNDGHIFKMNTSGVMTTVANPGGGSVAIITGPDGNL
jgi:hypothetical protein